MVATLFTWRALEKYPQTFRSIARGQDTRLEALIAPVNSTEWTLSIDVYRTGQEPDVIQASFDSQQRAIKEAEVHARRLIREAPWENPRTAAAEADDLPGYVRNDLEGRRCYFDYYHSCERGTMPYERGSHHYWLCPMHAGLMRPRAAKDN